VFFPSSRRRLYPLHVFPWDVLTVTDRSLQRKRDNAGELFVLSRAGKAETVQRPGAFPSDKTARPADSRGWCVLRRPFP